MSPITRQTGIIMILLLISTATTLEAQEPTGGPLRRLVSHIRQHRSRIITSTSVATVQAPSASPTPSCDCSGSSDPYGFTTILNRLRARVGLEPVVYDPELSAWATQNNSAQCHRGIGHHVNPCAVQNCAWNYPDASAVAQGWMNSPGHRRNLLSPSISRFGVAFGPGPYWTLNAR
jgi:uncharacterized protein YkwD